MRLLLVVLIVGIQRCDGAAKNSRSLSRKIENDEVFFL